MIGQGIMGWDLPYGHVNKSDIHYFIKNKEDGLLKANAVIEDVFNSGKLIKEQSIEIVERNQNKLNINARLKRFAEKRYLILISIKHFKAIESFHIDRYNHGNFEKVKVK